MQNPSPKAKVFSHRKTMLLFILSFILLFILFPSNLLLLPTILLPTSVTAQDERPQPLNLDALPDAFIEPVAQLISPTSEDDNDGKNAGGLLTIAAGQSEIAVQHTGFLQNSLTDSDLPEVRRHTEHIINILDGENGVLFGDLDRDGQLQNPGDGVGIRFYVDDAIVPAIEIAAVLEGGASDDEALFEFSTQTNDAINAAAGDITQAVDIAIKIFASDTIAEAEPFADELTDLIADLQLNISTAFTSTSALHDTFVKASIEAQADSRSESGPENGTSQIAAAAVISSSQLISATVVQSQIAVRHTDFLQSSLTDSDLPEVRRHAEHIINTLDGESGVLFGDLDRDGQAQNPGDGVGVRVYLNDVAALVDTIVLDASATDTSRIDPNQAQEIADRIAESSALVDQATAIALKIFAADTISETRIFGDELTEFVAELNEQNVVAQDLLDALTMKLGAMRMSPFDAAAVEASLQSLITAEEQAEIAVNHTGFLQNSLTDSDLSEARRHTEHIVNILDGEAGDFFGDLDRDGQPQNPGDGTGVRGYFADVLPFASTLKSTTTDMDEDLTAIVTRGDDLIDAAMVVALKIFAADTLTETQVFGNALTENVATIYEQSIAAQALIRAVSKANAEPESTDQMAATSSVDRADLLSNLEILNMADEQVQIAIEHTGFLQNSFMNADLPEARRHTEHIVNILDGESGVLYGDLDRDGQAQNPGDGMGLRVYLQNATDLAGGISGQIDSAAPALMSTAQAAAVSLDGGNKLLPQAFEQALLLFASDTITDALVYGDALTEQVLTIHESIVEAEASTRDLLQTGKSTEAAAFPAGGPPPTGAAGELWQSRTDNASYVFVPAGGFTIGVVDGADAADNERPAHTLILEQFWIAQTEITNAQYAGCVDAGVCSPPDNGRWNQTEFAEHPVTHVAWEQANLYAQWAGGRLPTEAEWEKACKGLFLQSYPWGNEPPEADFGNIDASIDDTVAVGSYPSGASPFGLLDMSGNVQEWTVNLEQPYPYYVDDGREELTVSGERIVRGGAYGQPPFQQRCAVRTATPVARTSALLGFRIVLDSGQNVWINPIDNAPYVLVPSGDFTMGSTPDEALDPNELPQHQASVDAFWLQQTETTNAQYGLCVQAGACTPPENERWDDSELADHPVTHVDWAQASAYAAWVGGRLPTEAEWEKACRGSDQRLYPWGNQPPSIERSNFGNNVGAATATGAYPDGASPFGALDMSGNVWEWTSSLDVPYPYDAADGREDPDEDGERVGRGGSFYYTQYQLRCTTRTETDMANASQHFGFRVAVLDE